MFSFCSRIEIEGLGKVRGMVMARLYASMSLHMEGVRSSRSVPLRVTCTGMCLIFNDELFVCLNVFVRVCVSVSPFDRTCYLEWVY